MDVMRKIVVLFLLLVTNSIASQTNILFLSSYNIDLPWVKSVLNGVNNSKQVIDKDINIYLETFDANRLSKPIDEEMWKVYLKNKYDNIKIDGIIAESHLASKFIAKNSLLLGNIPVIISNIDDKNLASNVTTFNIAYEEAINETINIALMQNKNISHTYIIDSNNFDEGARVIELLKTNLKSKNMSYTILDNYSLSSLKMILKSISTDSIVFYPPVVTDKNGSKYIPKDFLKEIASVSNAPIYTFYQSLMGSGCVGGRLINGELIGMQMVNTIYKTLHQTSNNTEYDTLSTYIDYQISQKYDLKIPSIQNMILLNQPKTIIEEYFEIVLISIIVMCVMIIMIIILVILNIKLKKSQKKLQEETDMRLQKEALLIQQSKMASIGEMLDMMSHQFKQPLNAISIYLYTIEDDYNTQELNKQTLFKNISNISRQIKFMDETINEFRNFFSPIRDTVLFDLQDSIKEVLNILKPIIKQHYITININSKQQIQILASKNELKQVILNIVTNSIDELVENGIDNKIIDINLSIEDSNCIVNITDNAGGIKAELLPTKLFEPYVSTKGSKGSGIGLYISKLIIENHFKGSIVAKNQDFGASFWINIPIN